MRFSAKNAKYLVKKINAIAHEDDRSFPGAIERVLLNHFKNKDKESK